MLTSTAEKIVDVSIWSVVEVDLSLICACMPSIRAFVSYIHRKIHGEPATSYSYSYDYSGSGRKGAKRSSKLIPGPSAVRSGTFDTENNEDGKTGEFIALKETETRSQSGQEGRESRAESQGLGESQNLGHGLSRERTTTTGQERRQSMALFDHDD